MRSWRVRVVRADGGPLSAADALRRFAWAALSLLPLGLGLWWCLIDREHLAWHDRASGTRLLLARPKAANRSIKSEHDTERLSVSRFSLMFLKHQVTKNKAKNQ
jgi:hypothetical protein